MDQRKGSKNRNRSILNLGGKGDNESAFGGVAMEVPVTKT
jgi:hypothetical protein